jgi:hypothetical protein
LEIDGTKNQSNPADMSVTSHQWPTADQDHVTSQQWSSAVSGGNMTSSNPTLLPDSAQHDNTFEV